MIAETLKKSILQAAIQGKLTEQLPEDGDARGLLEEIRKEKERLVREGKIKKEKPLPEIKEEEIPFDIPENWVWVRLGEVMYDRGQKTPDHQFTYIDISSIDNKKYRIDKLDNVLEPKQAPSRARKIVQRGDVIYASVRPYLHNISIIDRDIVPEPIVSTGFFVVCTPKETLNKYLFFCFLTPMFDEYACSNENSKGVAYPAINDGKFKKAYLPIPPLTEQDRIIKKVDKLFAEIDELKENEIKIEELQKVFPKKMKDSILQHAIQGKLTEQLPEDGDARDLLEEINREKAQLIREGKIKKEKPLPEIKEEEIPFDIPENWCWVRLGECLDVRDGTHDTPKYVSRGVPLVTGKNISNGVLDLEHVKFITNHDADKINKRSEVLVGDILFAMIGSIGNPVLVKNNEKFCIKNLALFKNIGSKLNMEFILEYLRLAQYNLKKESSGGVQSFISLQSFRMYLLPLPPLVEQKRIVEKLNRLLPLCDSLD
jgi:type I restriction enzyme S subunit